MMVICGDDNDDDDDDGRSDIRSDRKKYSRVTESLVLFSTTIDSMRHAWHQWVKANKGEEEDKSQKRFFVSCTTRNVVIINIFVIPVLYLLRKN